MTTKAFKELLNRFAECSAKGDEIEIQGDRKVTILASLGNESLVVAGVKRVELHDEMIIATTGKDDVFALLHEDVRALRFGKEQTKRTGLVG